eukprot:11683095-Alexandrium_andersonii.AAC.1
MQSAVRGGDCSRNIRRAFRHLGSAPRGATRWRMEAEPPRLWTQVLGDAATVLLELIRELDEAGISCCPATLF